MLMVCPEAFFQSNPPLTADAPFGALGLPPTPQALSTGRLAAAAPATPNAANMFRRDICGPLAGTRSTLIFDDVLSSGGSGGDQGDLHRFLATGDEVQTLLEVAQWKLVGADLVHRQHTGFDHPDRGGPAVRAEVVAEDVEILVVADDAPVDGDVASENAVLDVAAELAQRVEALRYRRRVSGALEIDVGAVSVGQALDDRHRILFGDVDRDVGATLLGQLELLRRDVERDDVHRVLGASAGDHAEADGPATGHHDGVLERDLRPLDGVQRAGQRFDEGRVGGRDVPGDLVHQCFYGIGHVGGHGSGRPTLEAVEIVRLAHVVLAALAEAALPAGHDLFGRHAVADGDAPPVRGLIVEFDYAPDEFVSGDHHRLGPGRAVLVAPELGGTVVALQVAGADADGLHPDERLAWLASGNGNLFEAVVVRSVDDDGLHLLGDLIGHQRLLLVWLGSQYRAPAHLSRTIVHKDSLQNICAGSILR